tara:strand:- start:4366 stop:4743 length:378 start_codon:yes stop_codon:yes gene_type:complete
LISGCSLFPEPEQIITIRTKTIEAKITHPSLPRPINLREPRWKVVSKANLDSFVIEMEKENGGQLVFVAMSIADYELMAYNMQEIKRYVNQQKEVIVYYRTLTTSEESTDDKTQETNPKETREKE